MFRSDRFTSNFTDKLAESTSSVSENSSTMVHGGGWLMWTVLTTMIIISFNSKQFSLDYFRNTQRPGNLGLTSDHRLLSASPLLLQSGYLLFSLKMSLLDLPDIIRVLDGLPPLVTSLDRVQTQVSLK